jgi:photosystem II stability/assembly factor-like uncharacterized protein
MRLRVPLLFALVAASVLPVSSAEKAKPQPAAEASARAAAPPPTLLKEMKPRSIGPAVMGGRVSEIALDPQDPYTFYVGLGTGGLMKTTDNGGSFQGVFDDQSSASVGAVAVAPSDPKVIWVGTGEANDRNSSAWGNGVYRSTDGGDTWQHVGLSESRAIARVVVHPKDPAVAWVAATGDLWTTGGERGLYKTTDAGKTWRAVLKATGALAGKVGAGDVALDPANPDVLYAALYARQRTPWSFTAGPPATGGEDAGGIFKSSDGGATWKRLSSGLPTGTGRIGLDVHRKDPRIVYAIVQSDEAGTSSIGDVKSKRGGVFRSADAGETWVRTSQLNPRPFYFSQIRVDPADDQKVYVLGFALHVSEDGGKTFREDRFEKIHPDCHALAIDPRNPKRMLLGTDGGVYQSYKGAADWHHLANMAAGEFYRINVDASTPFRICGGLQDNVNWVGPSQTRSKDGIVNADWINIGGGDGFYCVFSRKNPNLVFAESQEGYVHRFDLSNGQAKDLRPEAAEGQRGFRFHWNSPLIGSRHDDDTLYLAGNRVFRLTSNGEEWKLISPELSGRDPEKTTTVGSGAENYGVVYTLAESPLAKGLLWAGTDDGKVWVTENEGAQWSELTASLPAPVKGQWVSRLEAGQHDPKVAYLAVDAHRTGVFAPLAFRTADLGRTWQSVAGDLPKDGPVKVLREDPKNPKVLYAGTEFGAFVSLDGGAHFTKLDLPTVAVDDLLVHPRDNALVIATHGKSLFVLDDLGPVQGLLPDVLAKEVHLFAPRAAVGFHPLPGWVDWAGNTGAFRGENPPVGAALTYYLRDYAGETVKIAVKDGKGRPVANLKGPDGPGLHRVVWDLKLTKDVVTEYGGEGQIFVAPGEYKVTLTRGKATSEQTVKVEMLPGVETR